jgi:hypothetical protein
MDSFTNLEDLMIKTAFLLMSLFWMVSPITFLVMRFAGIFNYRYDWAIFVGFGLISLVTMFLTYDTWNDD